MKNTRRKFTAKSKAQVALVVMKGLESITYFAKCFEVHPGRSQSGRPIFWSVQFKLLEGRHMPKITVG
jgi:hypothetical protein